MNRNVQEGSCSKKLNLRVGWTCEPPSTSTASLYKMGWRLDGGASFVRNYKAAIRLLCLMSCGTAVAAHSSLVASTAVTDRRRERHTFSFRRGRRQLRRGGISSNWFMRGEPRRSVLPCPPWMTPGCLLTATSHCLRREATGRYVGVF